MKLNQFKLERYFAKNEFLTEYLLCCSDCDGLKMSELLDLADCESRALWENLILGYTSSKGYLLLREEVAKLYNGISPDNVLICAPEEGIFIAMNCLIQEKDYTICAFPGYQSLYEIAESLTSNVLYWNIVEPFKTNNKVGRFTEEWEFYIEYLSSYFYHLFRGRLNMKINLIINFPHNPTGCLPKKEDFFKIIEIVKENNDYVFSDEMYRFLEFDENDRLPSACEVYDKAVSLFGMSKTFGLAGLRIGWLVTKDKELMKKLEAFKDYITICSSAPSEILSLIALRNKDFIIKKNRETIKRNLEHLNEFFKKYSEFFSWIKPKAGTVCFPRLLINKDSDVFCERVKKEAGILLLPSSEYNYGNRHFRIGFGRKNMPDVLLKFGNYLDKI